MTLCRRGYGVKRFALGNGARLARTGAGIETRRFMVATGSAMTKYGSPAGFKPVDPTKAKLRKIDQDIATTGRELVRLVHERIRVQGRVSPNRIHSVRIDHAYVTCDFTDYPGDWLDIVSWRPQQ